jgi:two-component system phosphate regulon response regulator PhoB
MNLVRRDASRNSTNPCITIVEGDVALAVALSHDLKTEGYVVESIDRGDEALRKLAAAPPDLVILDWMLPGVSGLEICVRMRAESATRMLPIIMLSARGEEFLRLRGFSAGADDFVVKPFSMRELTARVRALLRRSRFAIDGHLLSRGDLQLDHQTRRVRRGLRDVHLRPKEFRLLECLLERPGWVFSRQHFWSALGGHPSTSPIERSMST